MDMRWLTILKNWAQSRRFHILPSLPYGLAVTALDAGNAFWVAWNQTRAARSPAKRNVADCKPLGDGKVDCGTYCIQSVITYYAHQRARRP